MSTETRWLLIASIFLLGLIVLLFSVKISPAHDLDNPALNEWYEHLMQPDMPNASCCGEADVYWADEIHVRNGKTYAVITDDRPDAPRMRYHIDVGTEIEVPDQKLKWGANDLDKTPQRNPTGHGVIFLSRTRHVYCYVQPGGV